MAKKTDMTPEQEQIAELKRELARTKKAAENSVKSLNVRIPVTLYEDLRRAVALKNVSQQEYVTETLKRSVRRTLAGK
jgi:predicted HicB family RNase H-like nuclease